MRVSSLIVGKFVHFEDAHVLLIETTTALTATRRGRVMEGWKKIDDSRLGGPMHKPSMDTMSGDRYLVSRLWMCW